MNNFSSLNNLSSSQILDHLSPYGKNKENKELKENNNINYNFNYNMFGDNDSGLFKNYSNFFYQNSYNNNVK